MLLRRTFPAPPPIDLGTLPETVRAALERTGHGAAWFANARPTLQLTVLNLHAKLTALDLWQFVARESDSSCGCLHFETDDLDALRQRLRRDRRFTRPANNPRGYWQARELRASGALHLKHFAGWPPNRIQAHIDPSGLWLHPAWWLVPLVPLAQLLRHALDYYGYRDVVTIRRTLERQGLDPCGCEARPGLHLGAAAMVPPS